MHCDPVNERKGLWPIVVIALLCMLIGYGAMGGVARVIVDYMRGGRERQERDFKAGAVAVTVVYFEVMNGKLKVPTNQTVADIAWQRYEKGLR